MRLFIFIIVLTICQSTFSLQDPIYKEVLQRGYEIFSNDSVRFPDGSSCLISDFNSGICGQIWFTNDYCVGEGNPVWDEDKCCYGLTPYLDQDSNGQTTCEMEESSFLNSNLVVYFFMGVLIPLSLFVILAVYVKKRLPK